MDGCELRKAWMWVSVGSGVGREEAGRRAMVESKPGAGRAISFASFWMAPGMAKLSYHGFQLASPGRVMSTLFVVHAAVTWALVGMIWTVQVVHYPLWRQIGDDAFRECHGRHMVRMTLVVAPLVIAEFLTAVALVAYGARGVWLLVSFAPMVVNWISRCLCRFRCMPGWRSGSTRKSIEGWWCRIGGEPRRGRFAGCAWRWRCFERGG